MTRRGAVEGLRRGCRDGLGGERVVRRAVACPSRMAHVLVGGMESSLGGETAVGAAVVFSCMVAVKD
jgi:hypothetical protein